jgi:hypothetical protein
MKIWPQKNKSAKSFLAKSWRWWKSTKIKEGFFMAIDTVVTFDDLLRQQGKIPSSSSSQNNNAFKASDYYNPGWGAASYSGGISSGGNFNVKPYEDYFKTINDKYSTPGTRYFDSSAGVENLKSTASKSAKSGSYASDMYDKYLQDNDLDAYINAIENKYGGWDDTANDAWGNAMGSTGGGYGGYGASGGSYNSGYDSGYQTQMAGIQDYINSMMAAYQQAYEAQLSAIREAQAAQERARREALGYAQGSVNQNSDEALRQAYIQSRKAQRDMPQQLAAQGISGGLSESTAASLQNQYGENRNELEQARQQALAQLASEYASGAATDASGYNMQIANILGQQAQQNAALQQWGFEQMLNARQNAASRARSSSSYKYYDDPEFASIAQEVITGQLSANDLRNMSGPIISRLGVDGYEYLMEQAQDEADNGFSFSDSSAGSINPDNLLQLILGMQRLGIPGIG